MTNVSAFYTIYTMKFLSANIFLTVTIALNFFGSVFAEQVHTTKPLHIRVVTAIYEPFVIYKDGKLVGFDVDLLNEICKHNNMSYTITITSFQDMLLQVKEGKADMAIGCIYVTEERERWFNFSDSYLEGGLVLVLPADSSVRTMYDLANMTVGVKKDASGDKYAMQLVAQGYDINVVRFQDTVESFNALVDGRLDAVLNDYLNSVYLLNKYFSGSIKIAKGNWGDIVYDRKKIAFPVSLYNKELLKIVSDSIHELDSQNFIDMLYWKWFAVMPPPDVSKRVIVYIGTVVMTVLFSFLIFQLYERRKRIRKLQSVETHFRNMINDLNVGVYILQKNAIVLTNNEGARIAGTSVESIMGKTLDDYFDEYSVSGGTIAQYASFDEMKALLSSLHIHRAVWKRKDGVNLTVVFRIRPIMWMGQAAVECVVNDTTELTHLLVKQEQLKGQLLQSQKLEIIGQIAGGIAHDFNNILTVILGYANLVEKSIDDNNKPAIEKIIQAGNHAKDIVAKLLTFSRKKAFHASDIHLHSIISNVVSLLHTALSKNCEVVQLLRAFNDTISGDATEMQQVIMNLMINAAEAMPQGGTITIQTENTTVANEKVGLVETIPAGDYVLLTISDTGTGIDPEHLEHIFEPLYTTKEKGSGLGLAIVYAIVKRHKGYIDVLSAPGVGTHFYIYLPVQSLQKVNEEKQDSALQVSNGTIIIIDDDDNICLLYQEALKLAGLRALTFTNPNDAFAYIDTYPDTVLFVISDVRMPVVTGEEVLDYVKKNHPDIPVVMMSGYYDDTMKKLMLQKGAHQVWQKMYDITEIQHKVKGVLNNYVPKNIIRG